MENYLASLSKRQTMLLLTAVTFGGQEPGEVFKFLPPEEAELLVHRAQEILQIPKDKRIPLLVQEIKRLVIARRRQIRGAEPDRLAAVLTRERPALVEVVLRAVPQGIADAARERLPRAARRAPKEVRPEVLNVIRWRLEAELAKDAPRRVGFKFSDILLLKARELLTVCDRLGAEGLGRPLAGLPESEREAFVASLAPDQRRLVRRSIERHVSRKLSEDDARTLLGLHGGTQRPGEVLRSAGAQRLARACVAQSREFAARVASRHPGPFGDLLEQWIHDEAPKVVPKSDAGRTEIVGELERLERRGVIDKPVRLLPPKKPQTLPGGKILPPPLRAAVGKTDGRSKHSASSPLGGKPGRGPRGRSS